MDRTDNMGGGNASILLEQAVEQALDLREALQKLPDPELDILVDLILIELGRRRGEPT